MRSAQPRLTLNYTIKSRHFPQLVRQLMGFHTFHRTAIVIQNLEFFDVSQILTVDR